MREAKRPVYDSASGNLERTVRGLDRLQGPLTHAQIASRTGLTASYVSRIWAGKRTPSLEVTVRLAQALGVSLPELTAVLLGMPETERAA